MPIKIIRRGKLIIKEDPIPPWEEKPLIQPLDSLAKHLIEEYPNLLVPWFLMAAWTFNVHDVSLVGYDFFVEICEALDTHWDDIEHQHKHLIKREALITRKAGYVTQDYCPGMTRAAAAALCRSEFGLRLSVDG